LFTILAHYEKTWENRFYGAIAMDEDDKKKPSKEDIGFDLLRGSPVGVGKTAHAKAMAEALYGKAGGYTGPVTITSDDMKEKDYESLSDIFTKAAKNKQAIIFDEVEKAADTELIRAAMTGDIPRAQAALDAGEDINHTDFIHGTALHVAARQGLKDMCRFLIDQGIDMHKEMTLSGHTPTHAAIAAGRDDIAVYLAMRGGKIAHPSSGIFGVPSAMSPSGHTPPEPKDDKFSQDVIDRIRGKLSAEQIKRAKSVAAIRRKRGRGNGGAS